MSPEPSKPRPRRLLPLTGPELASAAARPLGRKVITGKTGFWGSVSLHAGLIVVACYIPWVISKEEGPGNQENFQDGGVNHSIAFHSPRADHPPGHGPSALPPIRSSAAVIPFPAAAAVQALPPPEPWKSGATSPEAAPDTPSESPAIRPSRPTSPSAISSRHPTNAEGTQGVGQGQTAKQEKPVTPPRLLSAPPPRYPPAARSAKQSGKVAVLVRVRANGTAASTSLFQSSGVTILDQAAVAAARAWSFSPTPSLGSNATVAVVVKVTFAL